jgi:hypothetical protein
VECMVNYHLILVLERRNVSDVQCGFRCFRYTIDHLVNLGHHIQNLFLLHQYLTDVFFALELAYDTGNMEP